MAVYYWYIMRLKAKLTRMGDKYIIVIPTVHKDAKPLKGDVTWRLQRHDEIHTQRLVPDKGKSFGYTLGYVAYHQDTRFWQGL